MRFKTAVMCLVFLLSCFAETSAFQERPERPPVPMPPMSLPDIWEQAPKTTPKKQINLAEMKKQADELAKLASSIPPNVEEVSKGLLPKDLGDKLNRIEKLAKKLQSELHQ